MSRCLNRSQPFIRTKSYCRICRPSVLNVMQSGRDNSHQFVSAPQTTLQEASIPFDVVVDGHCSLKIYVK